MYIIEQDTLYTYDDIVRCVLRLQEQYKPLLNVVSIGFTHDMREIIGLEVGKGSYSLLCTGGVHARENINPMVLIQMADAYAKAYYCEMEIGEMNVKDLLKRYKLFIIPVLNPDGYEIVREGYDVLRNSKLRDACRNKKKNYVTWKENGRGIDLNRNFKSKSFLPNRFMLNYNSENEVNALIRIFHTKPSIGYLDFHSRGNSIFYHRNGMSDIYNKRQLDYAQAMTRVSGYILEQSEDEMDNSAGGNTVHYYSEFIRQPALTVETIPEEASFPLDLSYLKSVYHDIYKLPLCYLNKHKSESIQYYSV